MSKPVGPYTPAIHAGDFLIVSGQIGHIDEQLRLIKSAVESMSTMNQQIAQAIREQNLAVNEVNGNIISIREIGDSNLALAQASKSKTGELANMAGKLANLLANFKTH